MINPIKKKSAVGFKEHVKQAETEQTTENVW